MATEMTEATAISATTRDDRAGTVMAAASMAIRGEAMTMAQEEAMTEMAVAIANLTTETANVEVITIRIVTDGKTTISLLVRTMRGSTRSRLTPTQTTASSTRTTQTSSAQ